jgi:hypothetical protein
MWVGTGFTPLNTLLLPYVDDETDATGCRAEWSF